MGVVIIGSGSHGRMLWNLTGREYQLIPLGNDVPADAQVIIGIGNHPTLHDSKLHHRRVLFERYAERVYGYTDPTAIMRGRSCHPSAQIFARAVLNTDSVVEENCIVNTGAIIEHDAVIGAHSHIAPGAVICGNVVIGKRVHVGAGAVIIQGIRIGDGVVIGAGITVRRDLPEATV